MKKKDRGVALIIVLLVTALLIALIFEFAYGTRISLRAAVNFRNSQRAYYLARSGIYAFIKYPELQDFIKQGKWGDVPLISEGDTVVRIKWEDEQGKINIKDQLGDADTLGFLSELFRIRSVDQAVLDRMKQDMQQIMLLGDLHKVMSDEEFDKVSGYLTAYSSGKSVNVNTASEAVLESMGIQNPSFILAHRGETPYKDVATIPGTTNVQTAGKSNITNLLVTSSTYSVYKVYSYATVGGFTKQIEAVIDLHRSNTPLYWRAL